LSPLPLVLQDLATITYSFAAKEPVPQQLHWVLVPLVLTVLPSGPTVGDFGSLSSLSCQSLRRILAQATDQFTSKGLSVEFWEDDVL
jgi:hypothetical protein